MLHIGQLVYFQSNGGVIERGILALIKDENVKVMGISKRYVELKSDEVIIRHMVREFKNEKFDKVISIEDVASTPQIYRVNKSNITSGMQN